MHLPVSPLPRRLVAALLPLLAVATTVHASIPTADASVRTIRASGGSSKGMTFDLQKVHVRRIVSAKLIADRRTWRIDATRLRTAARHGRVRLRKVVHAGGRTVVVASAVRRRHAATARGARGSTNRRVVARAAHHGRGSHKLRIVTDTTPPETVLTAGPTEGAFLTESSTSFAFTGTDNVGISGYECSLDGGSFSACISPKGYSSLTAESHTFRVRAKDRGGNLDPTPARRTFTVSLPSSSVSVPSSPVSVPSSPVSVPSPSVLFFDDFSQANGPNNLITNEYASYNPNQAGVVKSPNWENRRGSTFFRNGMAWSGVPDGNWADKYSSTSNDSAWTNLRTHRSDFGNVKAEYDFMIPYLTSTSSSPAVSWDGSQMWLRYQTEQHLYTISFFDRSGKTYIKKKCPGGQQNGGTYYMLAGVQNTIPFGQWQHVAGIVQNNPGGTVTIKGYQNGKLLIQATDDHVGCPSITSAGRVGLRANNAEWYMDNFRVSGL